MISAKLVSLSLMLALCGTQDVIFDVAEYTDIGNRGSFGQIVTPAPSASTIRPVTTATTRDECYCVEYSQCVDNKRLSDQNSFKKVEISFFNRTCEHYLDVCCGEGEVSAPSKPVNPPQLVPQQPTVATRPPQISQPILQPLPENVPKPAKPTSSINNTPFQQLKQPGCGVRNFGGLDFSINDIDQKYAGFGEFPWTVAIINIQTNICDCAGSLITPSVILTAAHCIKSQHVGLLKVRAGEWDTQTDKERLPFQERIVAQIVQHPNFNSRSLYYDVAIASLETPFQIDAHIGTVCLPPVNYQSYAPNCFAAGWGKDQFGKYGVYSVMLKKVELPIVPHNECQQRLRNTRLSFRFVLHPSFMCAGGQLGVDTCEGDGGAALACPLEVEGVTRYIQTGIVAWGIDCNTENPGVYANVAYVREWIDRTVAKLGFDTNAYRPF